MAQAAHWFDLPRFYAEVQRIARPNAVLALITYGVVELQSGLQSCFLRFYHDTISPYWPPERALVDSGYATLAFPFTELPSPDLVIEKCWTLDTFLVYVSTWSTVRQLESTGTRALLTQFAHELGALWGNPTQPRPIRWPLQCRVGRVSGSD